MTAEGVPVLRGEYKVVPIDQIRPNPWNYNSQSDFIEEKMKASMLEFGFVEPLTVRSSNEEGSLGFYEIVGGEHRWKTAKALGMTELPVNDVGMMTNATLQKLMIVLNETKGRPDQDRLSAVLTELSQGGVDISVLPFDQAEIDSLLAMGNFNYQEEAVPTLELDPDEEEEGEAPDSLVSVFALEEIPDDEDERLAKRMRGVLFMAGRKVTAEAPWKALDLLIDQYYAATGKTEPE